MALNRSSIHDRELNKFVESPTRPGEPAVEVTSVPSPLSPPIATDAIIRTVLSNVETYEYKSGGISGTVLKTVTVTYTDATLDELVNVVVS